MSLPTNLINPLGALVQQCKDSNTIRYLEQTKLFSEQTDTQKLPCVSGSPLDNPKWRCSVAARLYYYIKDILRVQIEIVDIEKVFVYQEGSLSSPIIYKTKENITHLFCDYSGGGLCDRDSPVHLRIHALMSEYKAIDWWNKAIDKVNEDSKEFDSQPWINLKT
jgi:hypothetical protein